MDKEELLKDWLEGKIDPTEMERLKSDPDTESYIREFEDIINGSSRIAVPAKTSKKDAWDIFEEKIEPQANTPDSKTFRISKFIPYAVAAGIALFVSFYFLFPSDTIVQTGYEQQLSYNLPDGSNILLNADSKITYEKGEWEQSRSLELEGEAFFDVKPGSDFIVKTSTGSIKVLGTTFNVFSRKSALKVTCYSGKVLVTNVNENLKETLLPGKAMELKNQAKHSLINIDLSKSDWRSGDFFYEKAPFLDVISELERQYNIEIIYNQDTPREYNGYFSNKNLDEALLLVFTPMSLRYKLEGRKVIVE